MFVYITQQRYLWMFITLPIHLLVHTNVYTLLQKSVSNKFKKSIQQHFLSLELLIDL